MGRRRYAGFEGGDELARKLAALDENLGGALLLEATIAAAKPIETAAAERAPRASGELAESMDTAVESARPRKTEVHVGPGPKGWHGIFAELGTDKQPAQPFLRPAFDEQRDAAVDRFADTLRGGIRRVTGGGA